MYSKQHKKLLIVLILDILKKYTDENHRLSQNDIIEILYREYDMKADRKAVKRNLMNLVEFGFDIEYSETLRMIKSKDGKEEESYILSDFYLNHDFTDGELRLLIDSVMFSNNIPYAQSKQLIKKLQALSTVYFSSHIKHIAKMPTDKTDNQQVFYNIELLDEAMSKGLKVKFHYNEYHSDKKLHKRTRSDGSVREYIINPYQMAAKEGKYYLICNYDKFDDISNYRVDRICDLEILDEPVKPFESLAGANGLRLDISEYMRKHIYMFSSEDVTVKFKIEKFLLSDVIDLLGKDIRFSDETDSQITVTAKVNQMSMEQFAMSFMQFVTIISPASMREKIKENLTKAICHYEDE